MVVWEACNILMQRQTLPWTLDLSEKLAYQRSVHRGRGEIRFRLDRNPESPSSIPMDQEEGLAAIENFDMRDYRDWETYLE